ncbi:MAG: SDR family oxidoreductase, partial [Pseudomonadota bacterium]
MGCYDFSNKVALISGGSSGIGETLARQLAEHGCAVAVVASSTMNKAKTVADDITALGGRAVGLVGDVTDPAVCAHLVAQTQSEFGRLDILVNAAGVFKPSPAGATPTDDFNAMVDVNLKGTWNMISAVVDVMKAAGGGKILNFSSCAGVQALKGFAIYSATKAAISMMT